MQAYHAAEETCDGGDLHGAAFNDNLPRSVFEKIQEGSQRSYAYHNRLISRLPYDRYDEIQL